MSESATSNPVGPFTVLKIEGQQAKPASPRVAPKRGAKHTAAEVENDLKRAARPQKTS